MNQISPLKPKSLLNPRRGVRSIAKTALQRKLVEVRAKRFETTRLIFCPGKSMIIAGPKGAEILSPAQSSIMLYLCSLPHGSRPGLMEIAEAVWPDCDTMPEEWATSIKVRAHWIKKKLKAIGSELSICNAYGFGYWVTCDFENPEVDSNADQFDLFAEAD